MLLNQLQWSKSRASPRWLHSVDSIQISTFAQLQLLYLNLSHLVNTTRLLVKCSSLKILSKCNRCSSKITVIPNPTKKRVTNRPATKLKTLARRTTTTLVTASTQNLRLRDLNTDTRKRTNLRMLQILPRKLVRRERKTNRRDMSQSSKNLLMLQRKKRQPSQQTPLPLNEQDHWMIPSPPQIRRTYERWYDSNLRYIKILVSDALN